MVSTSLPAAAFMGVRQLRVALPSMWTVQAPHKPMPHPNLVPVSSTKSRRYHSRGISASPSNCRALPFTFSWIIATPHTKVSRPYLRILGPRLLDNGNNPLQVHARLVVLSILRSGALTQYQQAFEIVRRDAVIS